MIDDDGTRPALSLGAFAGVVDDERIDMRHRAERGFRETIRRQRQRLARQPFEIAMLAHVDDGIGTKLRTDPGIEREIAVRRY